MQRPLHPLRLLTLAGLMALPAVEVKCVASTSGDAILSPENQHQLITDWGYDIKEGGKAAGLTATFAKTIFVTDGMTCLRLPLYGDTVNPAHPSSGLVITS